MLIITLYKFPQTYRNPSGLHSVPLCHYREAPQPSNKSYSNGVTSF